MLTAEDATKKIAPPPLPATKESPDKEREKSYLALARQLAVANGKQCPQISYHVHWIYSKSS